jgi:hypothetical protein
VQPLKRTEPQLVIRQCKMKIDACNRFGQVSLCSVLRRISVGTLPQPECLEVASGFCSIRSVVLHVHQHAVMGECGRLVGGQLCRALIGQSHPRFGVDGERALSSQGLSQSLE